MNIRKIWFYSALGFLIGYTVAEVLMWILSIKG
jgi:hypothetical protein